MDEESFRKVEEAFCKLSKYRDPQKANRYFFIKAHFNTGYADDLSEGDVQKLLIILERYRTTKGNRCCDEHNENSVKMKRARTNNRRSKWYRELKRRMYAGLEKCTSCPATSGLTIDHILPVAKGG